MTAIEFENISKQYRLGLVSTRTLSHDLNRWWTVNVLRKEDPYLKIGETNDRATKGQSDYVWALKDINFKVEQGDVVGIIGKNGAGKSTLLKLLSKVTAPTTGHIRARGRIASLLEVGTGFHPEMTGRENIYMNGAILGMTRQEIRSKLDEIVDFSGCERYLDTPVKRYSSGMTVRLGFAIAAHLDPEILVVDEVLAVGDAEFQKKAIGKMKDVSQGEGRTVLFVSHNMGAVKALCKSGIMLERGLISYIGDVDTTVQKYLGIEKEGFLMDTITSKHNREWYMNLQLEIRRARLLNTSPRLSQDEPIKVELLIHRNDPTIKRFTQEILLYDMNDRQLGSYITPEVYEVPDQDDFRLCIEVHNHNLAKGKYMLGFNIGLKTTDYAIVDYDVPKNMLSFEIAYLDTAKTQPLQMWRSSWGAIHLKDGIVKILPII